ncbi:hypothetical protein L1D22_16870 [Vibrio sp. Isolate34]|uniref:hypothetical protein n=1 Tax=Vibrio sp. Isolate34 TaxID=2908540 RepID=UPI001EFDACF5|nr:hypothetical protein [Vibrio sp. Isolate34]MCG9641534.1 hypothetical protein [Vibrio sp. Isolate34]
MMTPIALPINANHHAYSTSELQQRLINMGCTSDLDAKQWVFDGLVLNFSGIYGLENHKSEWSQKLGIKPHWLARLLFLDIIKAQHHKNSLRNNFNLIAKWIFWLAERDQNQKNLALSIEPEQKEAVNTQVLQPIKKSDLLGLFEYLIMHNISEIGTPVRRLTPRSFEAINLREWQLTLQQLGLKELGFTSFFSSNVLKKAWKETINTVSSGELTYADWKKGGTLNRLPLDYGRHYIEHCHTFFSQHIALATALSLTLQDSKFIASMAGVSTYRAQTVISHFLIGREIEQLPKSLIHNSTTGYRKINDRTLLQIQSATKDIFSKHLRSLKVREALLSTLEILELAKELNFDCANDDEQDWLRHIVTIYLPELDDEHYPCTTETRELHHKWINEVVEPRLKVSVDSDYIKAWLKQRWELLSEDIDVEFPSVAWFSNLGLEVSSSRRSTYLHGLIRKVIDSGLTYVVALTGWRESEYGWSIQDIHIARNRDLLDQFTCPWRYTVKWEVPKTNNKTKLSREITHSTFLISQQLAQLVNADTLRPCLYPSQHKQIKDPNLSATFIKNRVKSMWGHFVDYYAPFIQLDKAEALVALRKLACHQVLKQSEQLRLKMLAAESLNEDWPSLQQDNLLVEVRRRARKEKSRVIFFIDNNNRRGLLKNYCDGKLPKHVHNLLEKYLSTSTKQDIRAHANKDKFSADYSREVVNELVGGCLYPTAHTFRHMWAEAVYRRFDGDAGWMIRSQFKHISQNMWLAYIRDKGNRRQHDTVKRRVISSLLQNHLRRSGKGFAGKLDTILRRVFAKTHVTYPDHLDRSIVQFAQEEIQDIKANPWGFCILLKRNQHRAKCAVDGTPQRQNACPGLCLGCSNNLIQEGNIQGILLGIANDVKVLETPGVPTAWREPAIMTVRNALKQLQRLKVAPTIMDTLQSALNTKEDAL